MNEQERTDKFSRDIDSLLRGETAMVGDAGDRALLDLARELLAADFSAETRLDLLRPRLAKPTLKGLIMSPRYRYVRWFVTTAALFTLIIAIILTVPPLRAIAQDILRQIGIIKVTDGPTHYELSQRPIPAVELARLEEAEWMPRTGDQIVIDNQWFVTIEWMPEGFDTVEYGYAYSPETSLSTRTAKYTASNDISKALSLGQMDRVFSEGPIDYDIGGAITEEVTVNGKKAVWVSGFTEHPDLDVQMLIWEVKARSQIRDDLMLLLKGHGLSKEEMLEIARSVTLRGRSSIPRNPNLEDWNQYSLGEIAEKVGFQVAVPQVLPFNVRRLSQYVYDGEDFTQVDTSYANGAFRFFLQQVKVNDANELHDGAWEINVGNTPVEDITINGNPGVWIENLTSAGGGTYSILVWEQDGFSFYMNATGISRADIFAVAESIEYVWPGQPDDSRNTDSQRKLLPAVIVAGQTGFAVAEPEYVPEGYQLVARDSRRGSEVIGAITIYEHENDDALVLHQGDYPESVIPRDLALGASRLIDVTVKDNPAIWAADYGTYPDSQVGMLVWEQNGIILRLQSAALGRDEMIRIAESLRYDD